MLRTGNSVQFGRWCHTGNRNYSEKVEATSSEQLAKLFFCYQIKFVYFLQNVRHILLKLFDSKIVLQQSLVNIFSLSPRVDDWDLLTEEHGDLFHLFLLKSFSFEIHFFKSFDDHWWTIVEGWEIRKELVDKIGLTVFFGTF